MNDPSAWSALLIDDDGEVLRVLEDVAERVGFAPISACAWRDGDLSSRDVPAVAIISCDTSPARLDALFDSGCLNDAHVVLLTGEQDNYPGLVRWLSHGSAFFLGKPLDVDYVTELLRDAHEAVEAHRAGIKDAAHNAPLDQFGMLRGSSRPMRRVYRLLSKVAPMDTSVLVCGESGTGKELVAETLHAYSQRADEPFLAVNCGAMPADLVESELFGHEKGSFSGADRLHRGLFERVGRGTLFLDEVTEMPADTQVKLLRVLETGRFRRVGGEKDMRSSARIVTATNLVPEDAVTEGKLREDLYYRVAQFIVRLPPLRDRGPDVLGLARLFLEELNETHDTAVIFSPEAEEALVGYAWPGNVRELKSVVERAYLLANSVVEARDLPELSGREPATDGGEYLRVSVGASLEDTERRLILATLDFYDGDKPEAAEALGISLKTLYNRLNRYAEEDRKARRAGEES